MKNTKTLILVLAIISVLLIAGCGEKTVYKDKDSTVVVDKGDKTVTSTVTTDEGTQTTTVTGTEGEDSWCPEGGEWTMASTGDQGAMNAEWRVDKLITSGKYAGLCHVLYTAEGPDGEMSMDYYFSEDGESGYFVMDVNGQKIESEWSP
ncbi:hypothetical protein KY328_04620 [Candidatus Woesearchaeota archaeon]|nr:hypothetical protein [Candidatus Woesearchaeota archaeon]MBW3022181.1 hypothetical protein [Candidatus Woesearchaeota archaeon]